MYSELDSYISMNQATLHNIFGYPIAMMVLHFFFYCFLMKRKTILVHEWGRNNQMGEKQPDEGETAMGRNSQMGENQPDGGETARWGRNSQI